MSPSSRPAGRPEATLSASWRLIQVFWSVTVITAAGVPVLLPLVLPPPEATTTLPLQGAFVLAGAADLAGVILVRQRLLHPNRIGRARSREELLARILPPTMVVVAMATSPVLLGVILYLVTGSRGGLAVMSAITAAALVLARPRLDRYLDRVIGVPLDA